MLQAVPPKGHKLTADDLDRSVDIMRNRVDKLGVSEPEIRKQSGNQIVIELAGVHDAATAARIIGKTAQLELYDLETSVAGPPSMDANGVVIAKQSLYDLLAPVQAKAAKGTPEAWYVFADKRLVAGPFAASKATAEKILAKKKAAPARTTQAVEAEAEGDEAEGPAGLQAARACRRTRVVVTCGATTARSARGRRAHAAPGQTYYYLSSTTCRREPPVPQMTGSMLELSAARAPTSTRTSGQPVVLMKFSGKGNKAFRDITRDEAQRGTGARQTPQHFAIVLDNEIRIWPQIDYTQLPERHRPDRRAAPRSPASRTSSEAKDIALVLQTGALPVKFDTIERTDVSATLGKDSLRQA